MTITSTREVTEKEEIVDDVSDQEVKIKSEQEDEVLAKLRARKAKKDDMPPKIVQEKTRSINIGVVGSGQGGSRIASSFYQLGYDAVVINTAAQDLKFIEVPEQNKLLLEYGLGGAGKDLEIGHAAAETNRDQINEIINKKLGNAQLIVFAVSLGGGSGAGSVEVICDVLAKLNKPVIVLTVLPQSSDDAVTKANAVVTLSKLSAMAQNKQIDGIIAVDNKKLESLLANVSQMNFFDIANKQIVEPIDLFNTLSSRPSPVKGLDPTEFGKLFTDGGGFIVYGKMNVQNYEDIDALANAVLDSLDGTLLADSFDLKQAKYAGVIFTASQKVWDKIPQAATNYAMAMIGDVCSPLATYKGIYATDGTDDSVTILTMFSGIGLPDNRVSELKEEARAGMKDVNAKDDQRNLTLKLDTDESKLSEAEKIKARIKAKSSSFGKLHNNAVLDKRK